MSTITNTYNTPSFTNQHLIPVCKGIITGLLITALIMLTVEQIHINNHTAEAVNTFDCFLTTKD